MSERAAACERHVGKSCRGSTVPPTLVLPPGQRVCLARMCAAPAGRLRKPRVYGDIGQLAFLPVGHEDLLLGGSTGGELHLWDISAYGNRARSCVSSWAAHPGGSAITCMCIAGTAKGGAADMATHTVVTGSDDHSLRAWDVHRSGCSSLVREFAAHTSHVTTVDITRDRSWIASAGLDNMLCLWDTGLRRPVLEIELQAPCVSCRFVADEPHLLLLGQAAAVHVIDLRMYRQSGPPEAGVGAGARSRTASGSATGGGGGGGVGGGGWGDGSGGGDGTIHGSSSGGDVLFPGSEGSGVCSKRLAPAAIVRVFGSSFQGPANQAPMLFDVSRQRYQRVFAGHCWAEETLCCALSIHGGTMALSATERSVKVWDAIEGAFSR